MPPLRILAFSLLLVTPACVPGHSESDADFRRETLPDGTPLLRYLSLPTERAILAEPDLEIGVFEGEEEYVFGDVRSVEAGSDGTIYVLDNQASEIRAFDREGRFLRTVAGRGEGPGEIVESNGMILLGDSLLWVQDHGQWLMLGLDPEGGELMRVSMHVRSYAYMWSGTVDNQGVHWKGEAHSDAERTFPPEEGLSEGTARTYLKSLDPESEVIDSVFTGESRYRTFISRSTRGGYSFRGIPFDSRGGVTVDPSGGFWRLDGGSYRISRLDAAMDTLFVIDVGIEPEPVTAEDRRGYVEVGMERDPEDRRTLEEVAELMPETKPIVERLSVDDEGRLWVKRVVDDADPLYDVFDAEGLYQGSVRLGFPAAGYFLIRVRDGMLYGLALDEMEVPSVVRTPLTGLGR